MISCPCSSHRCVCIGVLCSLVLTQCLELLMHLSYTLHHHSITQSLAPHFHPFKSSLACLTYRNCVCLSLCPQNQGKRKRGRGRGRGRGHLVAKPGQIVTGVCVFGYSVFGFRSTSHQIKGRKCFTTCSCTNNCIHIHTS